MAFNLRGGSPKSMKQGIYWVQRHLADQKRAAAQQNRVEKDRQRRIYIDEKFERIESNLTKYSLSIANDKSTINFNTTEKKKEKLEKCLEDYNSLRVYIKKNKYGIKLTAFNKLSTLARALIKVMASAKGNAYSYDSDRKIVSVNGLKLDFS